MFKDGEWSVTVSASNADLHNLFDVMFPELTPYGFQPESQAYVMALPKHKGIY